MTAITRQEVNLRQIQTIGQAAGQYKEATNQFLTLWLNREELNKRRTVAGEAVLNSAQATAQAGITQEGRSSRSRRAGSW